MAYVGRRVILDQVFLTMSISSVPSCAIQALCVRFHANHLISNNIVKTAKPEAEQIEARLLLNSKNKEGDRELLQQQPTLPSKQRQTQKTEKTETQLKLSEF